MGILKSISNNGSKKSGIKNLGNKLVDKNETNTNKDMSKELENLNKIKSKEKQSLTTIKKDDIQLPKNELDITSDKTKNKLIKSLGDVNITMEEYLKDFVL